MDVCKVVAREGEVGLVVVVILHRIGIDTY